ncbi:MAG TPA: 23S rRNA (uracil(1939)-C(5))-methyltransferase RlmD [Chryseosolibacter sp.]|nr:23S rRNA (uracil(1939)-C(5))-methyltransferase RlmD [Chryseosolibacter sp.]
MKKGEIVVSIKAETMAAEGKCVGKINGQVIFLEGCAPGDTVSAEITKVKSSFLEGRVVEVTAFSEDRTEPFCIHFGLCGGCSWQHINYETQLRYKHKQVIDNLERLGGLALPAARPIIPSAKTRFYRNKLDFTFSSQRWLTRKEFVSALPGTPPEPALGYHIPRKYDKVFDVVECHLQPDPSNAIRLAARDEAIRLQIPFFDLRKQVGFLRTLTIRTANTGEVMVILQVTYDKMQWIEAILQRLERDFPEITSFQYVINGKKNDTFHDLNIVCWKGNPYITEQMPKPDGSGVLQFRVGPKSFYQTNSEQAHVLYLETWRLARITPQERVYDLYTGTGTIANFVAGQAMKVVGLEYVREAIEDARVNSQINQITNTEFFSGDIKDLLDHSFLDQHGRPEVVITDPPRAGMHENVSRMLLEASPQRIVYVSCNAATQARDLSILTEKYNITAVQPVDMFPHTIHVENIVALEKRK